MIMSGATYELGSFLLIPTILDAYCTCNCASTTVSMEKLSVNQIWFKVCIASVEASIHLERKKSSLIPSAISYSGSSRNFRDLNTFNLQRCCIISQRNHHLVDYSGFENHCCRLGTGRLKSKCNSNLSAVWMAHSNVAYTYWQNMALWTILQFSHHAHAEHSLVLWWFWGYRHTELSKRRHFVI